MDIYNRKKRDKISIRLQLDIMMTNLETLIDTKPPLYFTLVYGMRVVLTIELVNFGFYHLILRLLKSLEWIMSLITIMVYLHKVKTKSPYLIVTLIALT